MKAQFDIWRFDFPERGEHSVILISHPDICDKGKMVNVLYCTSQRQGRKPYPYEVMLNGADGFEWETFCNCSTIFLVPSEKLFGKRGKVTLERRRQIREKIRGLFRLNEMD
ncbi:MAG TPA: type II toxin-antitoxin system PemK/MazF family toxin [Verrucomicrobiae bacterium]|jgi:mRNA-degrading endonuclease toxin of MazEF toxin-antitoxin module